MISKHIKEIPAYCVLKIAEKRINESHPNTKNPVAYIIKSPAKNPSTLVTVNNESHLPFAIWFIMSNATSKIAPEPIARKSNAIAGEYENPPIKAPNIVGIPAIIPIITR